MSRYLCGSLLARTRRCASEERRVAKQRVCKVTRHMHTHTPRTSNVWMRALQFHNLLNYGIDFWAPRLEGKRTWYPISCVSFLFFSNLYSLSHTHTRTHTVYLYILTAKNARQCEQKKNAPLNGEHCPSFGLVCVICTVSGCNIILVYREIFVLNVRNWFNLFDLNGI